MNAWFWEVVNKYAITWMAVLCALVKKDSFSTKMNSVVSKVFLLHLTIATWSLMFWAVSSDSNVLVISLSVAFAVLALFSIVLVIILVVLYKIKITQSKRYAKIQTLLSHWPVLCKCFLDQRNTHCSNRNAVCLSIIVTGRVFIPQL